jgi:NTP pyrophosphatase (non-canonical NTP hydrolase)
MDDRYADGFEQHLEEVVFKTWNRWGRSTNKREELINAVLGLTGEAGEVADLVKKAFYHKPLNEEEQTKWSDELVSEMGDVIYYWLILTEIMGLSHAEIFAVNREKLFARLEADQMETKDEVV